MKSRATLARALFTLVACSACGGGGYHPTDDLGGSLDDGHFISGCVTDDECDVGMKCKSFKCDTVTHGCVYIDKICPAQDACNAGSCDPASGMCVQTAAHETAPCNTVGGVPGSCTGGFCNPLPSCWGNGTTPGTGMLACGSVQTSDDDSTDPVQATTNQPTNATSNYLCAANETGPEVAYKFTQGGVDQDVTVTLTIRPWMATSGDGGAIDMAVPSSDLDLIILDSLCSESSACQNPALPGGGYQGITAGTGNETVTFHALANHTYFIVVDGKNGARANYHIAIQSCGKCKATPATTLACNMSMPLSGDTAKGTSVLGTYMCTSPMMTVQAPGNEQTFNYITTLGAAENVQATVMGAIKPVTLLAVPNNSNAECDPTMCLAYADSSAGSATIKFSADPAVSTSYWVVVDTPAAGADSTFGLTFACLPYCTDSRASFDCATRAVMGNNGTGASTQAVSAWGPSPGSAATACSGRTDLTGPEFVYLFSTPPVALPQQKYKFTLASTTPGETLTLVVLKATGAIPTCDPSAPCANTTGTYSTTTGGAAASVILTADTVGVQSYWVIVDGAKNSVSDYLLNVTGATPDAICP